MRYVFGDFVLDEGTRELLKADRGVPLSPKAFELLELLLRARPQAVSRTRLTAALWPSTHVGPTSLHVLASQVRAVLEDDAGTPRWIRTVPRFGYAFAGPASEEPAAAPRGGPDAGDDRPRLVFDDGEIHLSEGANVIGREQGAAVRLATPGVSRRHARIVVTGAEAILEDLGSKNGTFIRARTSESPPLPAVAGNQGDLDALDERVSGPRILRDGDLVRLGRHSRFVFVRRGEVLTKTDA